MADPFAIIGLTASIVSFIDFSIKIVSTGKELYDSGRDTTRQLRELSLIIEDVRRKNQELEKVQTYATRELHKDEVQAIKLAAESDEVAKELEIILGKLKTRPGRWRVTEASRIAIVSRTRKNVIDDLRNRLLRLDERVRTNLGYALQGFQKRVLADQIYLRLRKQASALMTAIESLNRSRRDLGINFSSRLDDLKEDIKHLVEKSEIINDQLAQLTSLNTKLGNFEKEQQEMRKQAKVIKSLHFPELNRRWSQIEEADRFTNSWLFDESQTSFSDWLKKGEGMFWISGKPGSGKSTLMKFASERQATRDGLSVWAGSATLYTATFFFWNQGFEMQKSKTGLLQSLLYQLLRRAPDSIPQMCYDHPAHEAWEVKELEACFRQFTQRDDLTAKFCFFIDGLDEYGGDEEDLSKILTSISEGPHVKFCVSCRHRPFLETVFQREKYSLDIQDFTREDMVRHVRQRLRLNPKFQSLKNFEILLQEIVAKIQDHAQGVWLWVYLVVRDLVRAVNRDEPGSWLKKIIEDFPPDLEGYFDQVIKRIKPQFRRDMVRIFLITLEEVQPLPLFAFSLLENEEQNPRYAVEALKTPISEAELEAIESPWKSRIINRCGDLLLVNSGQHPTFLRNPVDFMHRTVRDFLQDCYLPTLKKELGDQKYIPLLSLCNMMLYLLKKLPTTDLSSPKLRKDSIHRMIGLVDELLYYAHECEKIEVSPDLIGILDEVDRVNNLHAGKIQNQWPQARDSPRPRARDEYREGGNYNFLGLAVQARLVHYVGAKLLSDRSRIHKRGRPLLDYALRPRRVTPIRMPYHSERDDPSIDIEMIKLLLISGAKPNQKVYLNDGRTVWALFLISMEETTNLGEDSPSLKQAWYSACELLILNGADLNCWLDANAGGTSLTAVSVLEKIFGPDKAAKLTEEARYAQAQNATASWFSRLWWN